jgi:hypothetical protein
MPRTTHETTHTSTRVARWLGEYFFLGALGHKAPWLHAWLMSWLLVQVKYQILS